MIAGQKEIVYVVNRGEFFVSHRFNLAKAAQGHGYKTTLVCPTISADLAAFLAKEGILWQALGFRRDKLSLLALARVGLQALSLAVKKRTAVFHLVTIIPIVLVGPVLRLFNRRLVIAISGLGTVFHKKSLFYKFAQVLVLGLYRYIFNGKNSLVIVQNSEDFHVFTERGIRAEQLKLIKGSGVDPKAFPFAPKPAMPERPLILIPARLLVDKGIYEACQASEVLAARGIAHDMVFAGAIDPGNPTSLSAAEVAQLAERHPHVRFIGHQKDMLFWLEACDIVCLPSYHEGLPKALIEGFAVGRPVVGYDVRGIREIVSHNRTGLLTPQKEVIGLADQIEVLTRDPNLRQLLIEGAHQMFENELQVARIDQAVMTLYNQMVS